jgi:hypothetical protein
MRDGWRSVCLGSLFEADNRRLGRVPHEPPVYSLSKHDGFVLASDYFDARVASADLQQYKVLPPGGWAYSTIHIDEGSIARNASQELGVISPMYTTLRWCSADHDPGFFALLLRTPAMLAEYKARAQGTVNRRRSLLFAPFAAITVEVPTLDVQRCIVDLVDSLGAAAQAAATAMASFKAGRQTVVLSLLDNLVAPSQPLESVLSHLIGGAWGDSPGLNEVDVEALGLRAFGDDDTTVTAQFTTPRSMSHDRLADRALQRDDIVLERSGGAEDRPVGRVIVADEDMGTVVPTDFMRLLRVDGSRALPRFAFWWLWARYQRGDTVAFQTMTTNIRNLRVGDYLRLPIPIPSRGEQARVVEVAEAFSECIRAARREVEAMRRVRSALLAELLSGDHEIPASYDRFLHGAA